MTSDSKCALDIDKVVEVCCQIVFLFTFLHWDKIVALYRRMQLLLISIDLFYLHVFFSFNEICLSNFFMFMLSLYVVKSVRSREATWDYWGGGILMDIMFFLWIFTIFIWPFIWWLKLCSPVMVSSHPLANSVYWLLSLVCKWCGWCLMQKVKMQFLCFWSCCVSKMDFKAQQSLSG